MSGSRPKVVLAENYSATCQALYVRGKLVREEMGGTLVVDGKKKRVVARRYLDRLPDVMALAKVPYMIVEVDHEWLRRVKHFPPLLRDVKLA